MLPESSPLSQVDLQCAVQNQLMHGAMFGKKNFDLSVRQRKCP